MQNKANFRKAKMNVTSIITKDYENISPLRAPKKQTQFSKRQKPMQTSLPQRIMKMNHAGDFAKTNPNKPNFQTTDDRRQKTEDRGQTTVPLGMACAKGRGQCLIIAGTAKTRFGGRALT